MASPFTPAPASVNPMTQRQRDYLRDMMIEEARLRGMEIRSDLDSFLDSLNRVDGRQELDKKIAEVNELRDLARHSVIKMIDKAARTRDEDADIEGFWELADGRIVKVQLAVVQGSGNPYGKVLDPDNGRFNYTQGIVSEVRRSGTRLPLERAKDLGKLYGICICCGRTLTDEESIAAGIGPICAAKF